LGRHVLLSCQYGLVDHKYDVLGLCLWQDVT